MIVHTPRRRALLLAAWLVAAVGSPAAVLAQTTPPPMPPQPGVAPSQPRPPEPTISMAEMNRIKSALDSSPALNLNDDQLRYYVRVLAKRPTFDEFFKGYDLQNGPTRRGNPMSHQEFLAMVTPKEINSSGGITAMETLQGAFTNWLGQSLVRKALEDLKSAKTDKEVQEIRDRIERELATLRPPDASK